MMIGVLKRRTFLRWFLVNALAAVFFASLFVQGFFDGLSGAPLACSLVILLFSIVMTGYAGLLSWRTDNVFELNNLDGRKDILHDLNHVFHAIWVCQILGIVGALIGYREQTQAAAKASIDASVAVQEVFTALGNGLIATMTGVLFSLLFFIEYRLIEHSFRQE